MKTVLTIAGSDSGGGAGIQADLKTFAALGVHGTSAITAVTAQSTTEVRGVHALPASFVRSQIETVLDDFDVAAIKTGMLANAEIIETVADVLARRRHAAVIDPVMIASSGAELIERSAIEALIEKLLPLARVLTPNLPEAERLAGFHPYTIDQMVDAGRVLIQRGASAVLIKGGHLEGDPVDVLVERSGIVTQLESPRIETSSTHGTGCTYASAIAAFLAKGDALKTAVERAHKYLYEAIAAAPKTPALGKGKGPVHHFHPFYPFA
jgi:hydroxymethylpyrimidine/phosphomethylpyrimidine kinase